MAGPIVERAVHGFARVPAHKSEGGWRVVTGARGGQQAKCPACGENRFQWRERVRICNGCDAIGWLDEDAPGGSGRGLYCYRCEAYTMHRVAETDGLVHRRCNRCRAVVLNYET
jgi:hypothetical protein